MKEEETNMTYTSKMQLPIKDQGKKYCFLAGSIDTNLTTNWRKFVNEELLNDFHFFDPTRNDHDDFNDAEMKQHILWELEALELADKILLNFLPKALSPISLVELGLYVKSNKLIVVCPEQFHQYRYLSTLCEKYNVPCLNSLTKAILYLKND